MAGIDNALGVSPQVLAIRTQRMNLLSSNMANADTPNYKARDIDFKSVMESVSSERSGSAATLVATNERHFTHGAEGSLETHLKYRVPGQWSLDGNTVEGHREHAVFMENATMYQASLSLLDSRIKGLINAIRGGQ